jgi:hypothetical protein
MITLDKAFLAGLGLGELPSEDQRSLLAAIYEELELTVVMRLSERMSDEELLDYETVVDSGDDERVLAWLQEHAPDYQEVVHRVLDEQMVELRRRRAEILASAGVGPK